MSKHIYLGDSKYISNDGRYIAQWRLNAFYDNNPNGFLYAVDEIDGVCLLRLLLPEDKEYARADTQYEGVYTFDPEILESEKQSKIDAALEIAYAMFHTNIFLCAQHGYDKYTDLLPKVYELHPWLTPEEAINEEPV